jgi:aspartyl-tRNA(Asn)/glutamyl-tRNA(Gln) amidotransferase subunit B
MEYEPIIGLEVHAQLLTKSKIFCSCSTDFGAPPNKNTCPICLGMPGVLPVLNKEVVSFTIRTALATHCSVASVCKFARKNYFYPDLPKGYQISQYDMPLAKDGFIEIESNGTKKKISIIRIHMEEDAGKLIHGDNLGDPDSSYVDMNRCGVPLIEIVSGPDIRSPNEAKEFLVKLKSILQYLEVCDGNMEEGSLRCDANISVRLKGSDRFGTKTEIKNMNSFKNVQRALQYEINRHVRILEEGGEIIQETRLWDAEQGITYSMRGKEEAHDYRYFPEPDLVPIVIDQGWIDEVRRKLPELADAKKERLVRQYGIPEYDASVLTTSKALADYFESCVKLFPQPKIVSNWIMGEMLRKLKEDDTEIDKCPVPPEYLAELLSIIERGTISAKMGKEVFEEVYQTGKKASQIINEKGLRQITDEGELSTIIDQVLAQNPKEVSSYRAGKEKLFGFLVGQTMRATKGRANPNLVNKLLREKLKG